MGRSWRFKMVLLSTLAALVILVHSEENTASQEFQAVHSEENTGSQEFQPDFDQTLSVADPAPSQRFYANIQVPPINTEGPMKRMRRRKRPKVSGRSSHRRHKDGHYHHSHTKKPESGSDSKDLSLPDVAQPMPLGPEETVFYVPSNPNTIKPEAVNYKKSPNVVVGKVPRKSHKTKKTKVTTSRPHTAEQSAITTQIIEYKKHVNWAPTSEPTPKSQIINKMITRYDNSNDYSGVISDSSDEGPEEHEQIMIADPMSRRLFEQAFRAPNIKGGNNLIFRTTRQPEEEQIVTETSPTLLTPVPGVRQHNGNGALFNHYMNRKKPKMFNIMQINPEEEVSIPITQEQSRIEEEEEIQKRVKSYLEELSDYVQSSHSMNPEMNDRREYVPNKIQINQEENVGTSVNRDEQITTYQDELNDYLQGLFRTSPPTSTRKEKTTETTETKIPETTERTVPSTETTEPIQEEETVRTTVTIRPVERKRPTSPKHHVLVESNDYADEALSEKIYMSPETIAYLKSKANSTSGAQPDFEYERLAVFPFDPNGTQINIEDYERMATFPFEENGTQSIIMESYDEEIFSPYSKKIYVDYNDDHSMYSDANRPFVKEKPTLSVEKIQQLLNGAAPIKQEDKELLNLEEPLEIKDQYDVKDYASKEFETGDQYKASRPETVNNFDDLFSHQDSSYEQSSNNERYLKGDKLTSTTKPKTTERPYRPPKTATFITTVKTTKPPQHRNSDERTHNKRIKEYLKRANITSLSEMLQKYSMTLDDLLAGRKPKRISGRVDNSVKRSNSAEDIDFEKSQVTDNLNKNIQKIEKKEATINTTEVQQIKQAHFGHGTTFAYEVNNKHHNDTGVSQRHSENKNKSETNQLSMTIKNDFNASTDHVNKSSKLTNETKNTLQNIAISLDSHSNSSTESHSRNSVLQSLLNLSAMNNLSRDQSNQTSGRIKTIKRNLRPLRRRQRIKSLMNRNITNTPVLSMFAHNQDRLHMSLSGDGSKRQEHDMPTTTEVNEDTTTNANLEDRKTTTTSSLAVEDNKSEKPEIINKDTKTKPNSRFSMPTRLGLRPVGRKSRIKTQTGPTITETKIRDVTLPTKKIEKTHYRDEPVTTTQKNYIISSTERLSKMEIQEILNDTRSIVKLSKILSERNMTLHELLLHRERGSSNVHLADIFHNASKEPNPEPEPFLSKSLIEPISRETYPLRALLEANQHDPVTKISTTEISQTSRPHVPVIMNFKNNVNENGENVGIISIFHRMAGKSPFHKSTIQTDSRGTPYISSVISVNTSDDEDNMRKTQEIKLELINTTVSHLNNRNNILKSVKDKQDNEKFYYTTQIIESYTDSKSLSLRDFPPVISVNAAGPGDDIGRKMRVMDVEITNAGSQLVSWKNMVESIKDNRDLDNSNQNIEIIKDSTSRLKNIKEKEKDIVLDDYNEDEEVNMGISEFHEHSYSHSIPMATAGLFGLAALLFLITYFVIKMKYKRRARKSAERKEICEDDCITPRVFERQKSISDRNSSNYIPFIASNDIYSLSTSKYEWEDLRDQSLEAKVSEKHSSGVA